MNKKIIGLLLVLSASSLGIARPATSNAEIKKIHAKLDLLMKQIKILHEHDNWLINAMRSIVKKRIAPGLPAKRNQFKKQETEADAAWKKIPRI